MIKVILWGICEEYDMFYKPKIPRDYTQVTG